MKICLLVVTQQSHTLNNSIIDNGISYIENNQQYQGETIM